MENSTARGFLSTGSAEASAAAQSIVATVVDLVGRPQVCVDGTCKALAVVSRILHTQGCGGVESRACSRALTPFSRREVVVAGRPPAEGLNGSAIVTEAYPCVLAKLDDKSEDVRLCALQTLGEFIPFIRSDGVGYQRQLPDEKLRFDDCEVTTTESHDTAGADRLVRTPWLGLYNGLPSLTAVTILKFLILSDIMP